MNITTIIKYIISKIPMKTPYMNVNIPPAEIGHVEFAQELHMHYKFHKVYSIFLKTLDIMVIFSIIDIIYTFSTKNYDVSSIIILPLFVFINSLYIRHRLKTHYL
jgi:hypothetical protein